MTFFKPFLALGALAATLLPQQAMAQDRITVMTQNQYLGADLTPLLTAHSPAAFNEALVAALEQVAANDFDARAKALAANIGEREPDLVGLQEVWSFFCIDFDSADGQGCEKPRIAGAFENQLEVTLAALGEQGTPYYQAASVTNLNLAPVPFTIDGVEALLFAMDRDVILARDGLVATPVDFGCEGQESNDGCNFQAVLPVATPIGDLLVERGFVGVDVTLDEQYHYRFVNTHLEVFEPVPGVPGLRAIQAFQAQELLERVLLTLPPESSLIVAGDFNSSPTHTPLDTPIGPIVPPYQQFLLATFNDVWTLREDANSGFTCCQAADLGNKRSNLFERIDMIFTLDLPLEVKKAHVLGAKVGDKTPPPGQGLWPSDHGSLVAEINY